MLEKFNLQQTNYDIWTKFIFSNISLFFYDKNTLLCCVQDNLIDFYNTINVCSFILKIVNKDHKSITQLIITNQSMFDILLFEDNYIIDGISKIK